MSEPVVVSRAEQPYVGVRATVTMSTFPVIADRIPELFGWLAQRGITPTGAPFFRYDVIGPDELEVQAGVPVAAPVDGDGDVFSASLPGGEYVVSTHVGHPDGLVQATDSLLTWGRERGVEWDASADGREWGCRLEIYQTDPRETPDMNDWTTVLAVRLVWLV